jgi:hypothetical protein
VCEEDEEPHTTSLKNTVEGNEEEVKTNQISGSLPSENNTLEKRAGETKPDTSVPPPSNNNITPNRHVQGSKRECSAAPEVARLQAEILRIPLTNGRTFQCNGKLNAIIGEELLKGRSAALILQAAKYIGKTLPDRDQMPGLTLADNLAATIIAAELGQAAVEEQERRALAAEQHRRDIERLEREPAAKVEIKREEVAALRERCDWEDCHGSHCDGFISTNPTALYRADLEARIEQAYRDHSSNYSVLRTEALKLETEAVEARLDQSLATVK